MGNATRNPNAKTYSKKELTGYLVGLAGQNIIYNIVSAGLMYYFQNIIFVPAMICSVIVTIARVWDAINDPMMGTIVDKTHTKWGKCKPYLLFVPVVVMVVTILCFINGRVSFNEDGSFIMSARNVGIILWAGFSYILWGMSYTAGDIPLWGVTSLMTEDAKDRAKILALARIVASVGFIGMMVQLAGTALAGVFEGMGVKEPAAQQQYSVIAIAVILTVVASIMFQFAGFSVKEKVHQATESKPSMKENFKTMWRCRPFRQLLISGVLRSPIQLLTTVAITLVLYFFFDNDAVRALMTEDGLNVQLAVRVIVIAVGIFGGMLVSSALTPSLAAKFEKKNLYNFFSIVGAIPFGLVFVIYLIAGEKIMTEWLWTVVMGLVFLLASAAMGGLNVLQSVMIADCVDYEEYHNGNRPDGVFFSGQSFITKLSAGIATMISGVVFSIVGWSGAAIEKANTELAGGTAHFATMNGGKFATAMFFLVSIPPMVGMILSAIPTWRYALPNSEHKRILSELLAKRHGTENAEEESEEVTAE